MEHISLNEKLSYFIKTKQIPNIIFHGDSGSGKRTIVNQFLLNIYGEKLKLKSNVMMVNCSHGKGIKFIREDLKFFAKTNISSNKNELFKSIVLLNADSLTIDAQSALRRCIEVFCHNTRFFIIVENKHKLLIPIISRFCEIHVPKITKTESLLLLPPIQNNVLYSPNIKLLLLQFQNDGKFTSIDMIDFSNTLYEKGFMVKYIIDIIYEIDTKTDKELIVICYHKLKSDFRCERMFFFYVLTMIFISSNNDIKDMLLL